jgi:putative molybdopterin biosynthesis protein
LKEASMEGSKHEEWLTIEELGRWLRLGRSKTYELIWNGEIPAYRIGRVLRIRRRDVEAWLESNRYRCLDRDEVA